MEKNGKCKTQNKSSLSEDERAVSPVIGVIMIINCCIPLSCGQKRFPLFEFICGLEFKSQDLILEP